MLISVLSLVVAVLVFLLVALCGSRLATHLQVPRDIRPFAAAALGWAIVSYATLGFGFLQGYSLIWLPWAFLCLVSVIGLRSLPSGRTLWRSAGQGFRAVWSFCTPLPLWARFASLMVVLLWVGSLIGALAPSTGWDANTYHLAIPNMFLREGGIKSLVTINGSFFQLFPQMQYLFFMWLGFARAAQVLPLLYLIGLIGVMAVWSRQLFKSSIPWAVLVLGSIPAVWFSGYESLVDIQGWFYFTLGCYFIYLFSGSTRIRYLVLSALFLGMAVGCKVTNILFFPLLPVMVYVIARQGLGARPAYHRALGATAIAGITAAPWYLHGLIVKGNPIWPFFAALITPERLVFGFLILASFAVIGDLALDTIERVAHKKPRIAAIVSVVVITLALLFFIVLNQDLALQMVDRLWFIVISPVLMTFAPEQFGGDAPRLGPLVLTLFPLFWLVQLRTAQGVWARMFGWWFFSFYALWLLLFDLNDTRHALIIVPVLLVLLGPRLQAATKAGHAVLKWALIGAIILALGYNAAIVAKVMKPRLTGIVGSDASLYLSQAAEPLYPDALKMPEYPLYAYANRELPENATVLLVGEFGWYYLDRRLINGRPDQQDLIVYDRYESPEALRTYLQDLGVTYIISESTEDDMVGAIRNWGALLEQLEPLSTANGITLYRL